MPNLLTRLLVEGFTSHTKTEIEFAEPITIVTGPEGVGKSSIKDAIEWGLTGAARTTDAGGRGYESLMGPSGQMRVGLECAVENGSQGPLQFVRSADHKGTDLAVKGMQGGLKLLEGKILSKLGKNGGVTKDQIHALLNSTRFFSLSTTDQKKLLVDSLGLDFGLPGLIEMVKDHERADKWVMIVQDLGEAIEGKTGAALLSALDKAVRDERTLLNREVKRLAAQLADEAKADLPIGITVADKPKVEVHLKARRQERDTLLSQKQEADNLAERRAKLEKDIEDLGKRHDAAQAEIKQLGPPVKPSEEGTSAVDALDKEIREAEDNRRRLQDEKSKVDAGLKVNKDALDAFESASGKCVVLPAVKCPVVKDQVYLETLRSAVKTQGAESDRLDAKVEEAIARVDKLRSKREKLTKPKKEEGPTEREIALLEQGVKALGDEIDRKSKELTGIIRGQTSATRGLDTKIEEIEAKIEKGEEILAALIKAEAASTGREAKEKDFTDAQDRAETLDALVTELGPKGVVSRLIQDRLTGFVETAGQLSQTITGGEYELSIIHEPDLGILITREGSEGRIPAALSDSEQIRMGVPIQAALAEQIGVPLVVIDRMETLVTPAVKRNFSRALAEIAGKGIQVIAIGTGITVPDEAPDGVQYVRVGE